MGKKMYTKNGFTLIELMVAVALFSVVMVIAVGSLLSILEANRKAQSTQVVINNLSFALESLSRSARVGTMYHCGDNPDDLSNVATVQDCAVDGGSLFAFEAYNGDLSDPDDQVIYALKDGVLQRSVGDGFIPVTPQAVTINKLRFYVRGSDTNDTIQPFVLVVFDGTVELSSRSKTDFRLQTSFTQRIPDIPF